MKFEDIIKKISMLAASLAVFVFAAGAYLSWKGFVPDGNGGFVLVKTAQAAPILQDNAEVAAKMKTMTLPQGHILGKENAPVTIYEYSSFGCYHCADFHLQILPKLQKEYIDKGLLKVVFVDFPLDKKSMYGSLVSRCVTPEKYHPFISLLFKKQRDWSLSAKYEKVISQYAMLSGLSGEQLQSCMDKNSEAVSNEILSNRRNAVEFLQLQGTPSFLIVNGMNREILHGIPSYEKLSGILNEKLGIAQKK